MLGARLGRTLANHGEVAREVPAILRRTVGVRTGEEASRSSASSCRTVSRSQSTIGVETFGDCWDRRGDLGVPGASARGVGVFVGVTLDGIADGRSGDTATVG